MIRQIRDIRENIIGSVKTQKKLHAIHNAVCIIRRLEVTRLTGDYKKSPDGAGGQYPDLPNT